MQIAQPTNVSVPFAELVFRDIRIHGSLTSKFGCTMFHVKVLTNFCNMQLRKI